MLRKVENLPNKDGRNLSLIIWIHLGFLRPASWRIEVRALSEKQIYSDGTNLNKTITALTLDSVAHFVIGDHRDGLSAASRCKGKPDKPISRVSGAALKKIENLCLSIMISTFGWAEARKLRLNT
jgi:hypothetical protein